MDDSAAAVVLSSLSRKKGGFICTYQGCFFAATQEGALSIHVRTSHEGVEEMPYRSTYEGCDNACTESIESPLENGVDPLCMIEGSAAADVPPSPSRKEGGFKCIHEGCDFVATRKGALSKHVRTTHEGD